MRRLARVAGSVAALLLCPLTQAQDRPLLHEMFQDHAVLQRGRPIPVFGDARPGERVRVRLGEVEVSVTAGADGRWQAQLPERAAGGPYVLTAETPSGARSEARDLLVGDVWLCSGQSNMVLPVHRSLDARAEIAGADEPQIRLLQIANDRSATPLTHFASVVAWTPADSGTVADFSAACYYYARELRRTVDVPMGLIAAAWGGSRIETWMGDEALRRAGFDEDLALLEVYRRDPAEAVRQWSRVWIDWWQRQSPPADLRAPWREATGEWAPAPAQLGPWEHWGLPALSAFNGLVWYASEVVVEAGLADQAATLELGVVDEFDLSWINARPVGSGSWTDGARHYTVPAGTLQAGRNRLVVAVFDGYATGGLLGPAQDMSLRFADGTRLSLRQPWRYRVADVGAAVPPRPPWEPTGGLGIAGNAMIAPIAPYALRGVLWYQGESNTHAPQRYRELLSGFMDDWRRRFGQPDLPFLIVQLANYGAPTLQPSESGWAELREAQRQAVAADPRAALVLSIDIGEPYDIHPPNKQELGRRLARAARHLIYGETLWPSGPRPQAPRTIDRTLRLTFGEISGRLVALGGPQLLGFELCGAGPDSCRYAEARLDGDAVLLKIEGEAPARIRYCWADSPVCTLFDHLDAEGPQANLPVGPFELWLHGANSTAALP